MSYESYRAFVGKMTEDELTAEIEKLTKSRDGAKTQRGYAAWTKMLEVAKAQQKMNAS